MQLTNFDDPIVDPTELAEANRRCEDELMRMGIDPKLPSGIRAAWNPQVLIRRGPLTDRKLSKYAKEGWFSEEFRQARRSRMEKKTINQPSKRTGSFFERGGRLIYSP